LNILVLLNQLLYPPDAGGKIRSSKTFEYLKAAGHHLTVVSFIRPREGEVEKELMMACCDRLITVPWKETPKFTAKFYAELAVNLLSPYPYIVKKYHRREMESALLQELRQSKYDLLLCDFLQPSLNLRRVSFSPMVLFQHNVETQIRERHYKKARNPLTQFYLYTQYRKLRRYEGETCARFAHNIMVSEEDKALMLTMFGLENTSAIPTGVDLEYFIPDPGKEIPGRCVFTGSMDWLPNEDAVAFWADEIAQLVKSRVPQAQLYVVGRRPTKRVRALAERDRSILVTGDVPDIRPYCHEAEVYVIPLRIGGGTRIKIFEAMAMGKAIVSTFVGAEGLPVTDGENILLADSPTDFAEAVVRVLNDSQLRQHLGTSARRLVEERYGWDAAGRAFEDVLLKVVAGGRST